VRVLLRVESASLISPRMSARLCSGSSTQQNSKQRKKKTEVELPTWGVEVMRISSFSPTGAPCTSSLYVEGASMRSTLEVARV